jgi:hypothetical protein
MAGPSIGTWVKVKTKTGLTPRVIPNKDGGGQYSQGQVITQSEFNELRQKRAGRLREKQSSPSKSATQFSNSNLFQYKDGTEVELVYQKKPIWDNQVGNTGYREIDAYTLSIKPKGGLKFKSLSVETRSREAIDNVIKGLESEHGKIIGADKFENVYEVVRSKKGRMLKTPRLERKQEISRLE